MTDLLFNLPKDQSSIIKVIGVGGGGSNAVNHMFKQGIIGVNFVVCNTDQQALEMSPVPNKIQLGPICTSGLGAGSNPDVGKMSCEESEEDIRDILSKNTKMVFITAGMGGGTGTGAAPVVARIAHELGILTVGIVTTPFSYEGSRKINQADEGIRKMKEYVDTVLVISNDKLREMYSALKRSEAFAIANNILATAAKSISEIITVHGDINVDFADVEHVMRNSGVAIMGVGMAEGQDRALRAVESALNSPLLNDNDIRGAQKVLVNISSGSEEMSIEEIDTIIEYIRESAGQDTDVIFGAVDDQNLGEKISVTIIATGFSANPSIMPKAVDTRKVLKLDNNANNTAQTPMQLSFDEAPRLVEDQLPKVDYPSFDDNIYSSTQQEEEEVQPNSLLDFRIYVKNEEEEVKSEAPIEEVKPSFLSFDTPVANTPQAPIENNNNMDFNKGEQNLNERKNRLKDLSMKFQSPQNLQELENQPAYMRRNIELDKTAHSSESEVSKYTVNTFNVNGDNRPEIRKNNLFLHDTVD